MIASAVAESVVTRMETCPVHNIPFGQIFFRSWPTGFWTGCCPKCASEEKLKQRADEFLRSQNGEIVKEATATIQKREHQTAIERRTEKDLTADVAEYKKLRRPLWESYERDVVWNQIVCEIEDRKRTEFFEQSRKKET